jgi:hypothetical protein
MRRLSPAKVALTGISVAALTVAGAYATAMAVDEEPTTVVNKNGKEVDEHAADGQARAAEARAAAEARRAAKAAEPDAVEEPKEDNGNHGGPVEQAGDHPDANAFLHPEAHEPQGPKPDQTDNAGGLGPDDHAGDYPNDNATAPKEGKGGTQ